MTPGAREVVYHPDYGAVLAVWTKAAHVQLWGWADTEQDDWEDVDLLAPQPTAIIDTSMSPDDDASLLGHRDARADPPPTDPLRLAARLILLWVGEAAEIAGDDASVRAASVRAKALVDLADRLDEARDDE